MNISQPQTLIAEASIISVTARERVVCVLSIAKHEPDVRGEAGTCQG